MNNTITLNQDFNLPSVTPCFETMNTGVDNDVSNTYSQYFSNWSDENTSLISVTMDDYTRNKTSHGYDEFKWQTTNQLINGTKFVDNLGTFNGTQLDSVLPFSEEEKQSEDSEMNKQTFNKMVPIGIMARQSVEVRLSSVSRRKSKAQNKSMQAKNVKVGRQNSIDDQEDEVSCLL